jgi:enoyl-CoA hydratase/carnithine racemase
MMKTPECVMEEGIELDTPQENDVVTYEVTDGVAVVTMNRPRYRNAQNSVMTYALDAAFTRAVDDDDVKVIVLAGTDEHFSAGHDIGTPARDHDVSYDAKEILYTGERFGAQRAYQIGMVNRVAPRSELEHETRSLATRIATMSRFGLALTKRAVNQCEDHMGLRNRIDGVFGLHHFAHAHNAEIGTGSLGGMNAKTMPTTAGDGRPDRDA